MQYSANKHENVQNPSTANKHNRGPVLPQPKCFPSRTNKQTIKTNKGWWESQSSAFRHCCGNVSCGATLEISRQIPQNIKIRKLTYPAPECAPQGLRASQTSLRGCICCGSTHTVTRHCATLWTNLCIRPRTNEHTCDGMHTGESYPVGRKWHHVIWRNGWHWRSPW